MCGIAGVLDRDRQTLLKPDLMQAMTHIHIVRYHGPDGEGLHMAHGLGLGHRRLAVIDPGASGTPRRSRARTSAARSAAPRQK